MGFPERSSLLFWLCVFVVFLRTMDVQGKTFPEQDSLTCLQSVEPDSILNPEKAPCRLLSAKRRQIEFGYRPELVFRINDFLRGNYADGVPVGSGQSFLLKYSFGFAENTFTNMVYKGVYQGIGLSFQTFRYSQNIGTPTSVYLFQGSEFCRFTPRLSFNYEWNFGLSGGWNCYNVETNPYNTSIGSKVNAYMNLNFYLKYRLSSSFDLATGISLTHYSNGNTKYPNNGLNTVGLRLGLVYNVPQEKSADGAISLPKSSIPKFPRHISYDCVAFGSWRRKGVMNNGLGYVSPEAYPVSGFNFAPMFNAGYTLRAGVSLDGVYDRSANTFVYDSSSSDNPDFRTPAFYKQLALGLSARTELVMPYFRINLGIGANFVGKGDLKGTYQVLALKIETSKSSFLHIGYNLKDFHLPNYLMLGVGYRFHDKYPVMHRRR